METDENKSETRIASKKIDEIIERSNTQRRILKKVFTELSNRAKLLEQEEQEEVKSFQTRKK